MSVSISKYGALPGGIKIPAFLAGLGTRDLRVFPVPGLNILLANGFDPYAKGLKIVPTPRHANILLVAAPLPEALKKAAATAYAQMPRPRVLVFIEMEEAGPLPEPDLVLRWGEINSLPSLLNRINQHTGKVEAFAPSFLTKALDKKSEDGKGHDHDHMNMGDGDESERGKMQNGEDQYEEKDHKKMDHSAHDHAHMNHQDQDENKKENENGSGENDGMSDKMDMNMDQDDNGDGGMDFMSMVMMTKGKPTGKYGLVMDRNEVHFCPFHPGLPDGLAIKMTLDGDTVVHAEVDTALTGHAQVQDILEDSLKFPDFFKKMSLLQPETYKMLATQALYKASGVEIGKMDPSLLERERILNHLLGIATLQKTLGDREIHFKVSRLILDTRQDKLSKEILRKFVKGIKNRWYLKSRLKPLAEIPENLLHHLSGPLAKAVGKSGDLRLKNPVYDHFEPISLLENNAWGHLLVMLDEIEQSFNLMEGFKDQKFNNELDLQSLVFKGEQTGSAAIETANGAARMNIVLDQGKLKKVKLKTPSIPLAALVPTLTKGLELGDALVSIASLQIAPYEINPDLS